jgi:K+-transporting ATPase ATPase C chain
MLKELKTALALLALLSVVTGGLYPLVVTGVAQVVLPHQASGSLIKQDGKVVGSELIGQPFSDPKYFWPRPSATGPVPYNAGASSGSNLGPLNPALEEAVKARIKALKAFDPGNPLPIPVDLVTTSGSGLDPHISPAAAEYQMGRVARARGLEVDAVRARVVAHTEGRAFGVLGEPRINVLKLNLAMDSLDKD